MVLKKRTIVLLAIFLLLVNVASFLIVFVGTAEKTTGAASATATGTATLCLAKPPTITAIADQTATVNTAYTLQVSTTFYGSNTSIIYSDNTSLFNINQSGYISFTPSGSQVGTHSILITVQDSSNCDIVTTSTTAFLLTISTATTPTPTPGGDTGGGGGGGGGSGGKKELLSLDLSENIIKVNLKQSEKLTKSIEITNDGDVALEVNLANPLEQIMSVSPTSFTLSPKEIKTIWFVFNPFRDVLPDIYTGTLDITGTKGSKKIQRTVSLVIEIESEQPIFDASLDLARKTIYPGEDLKVAVSLFNLGGVPPTNLTIIHFLLDMNNSVIYQEEETVFVSTKASFSKTIIIPEDIKPGQYVYSLKVPYQDSLATATEIFTIEEKTKLSALVGFASSTGGKVALIWIVPAIFIVIITVLVALYFTYRKIKKAKISPIIKERTIIKNKTIQRTIIKPKTIIKRDMSEYRRKLATLKEGYNMGYIKEGTYKKLKGKLEEIIKKGSP